jgi:hypothetical protein
MDENRIIAYGLWLAIVAATALGFRMSSCQETVESYRTKTATCECLEPGRVSVSVETAKPTPTP